MSFRTNILTLMHLTAAYETFQETTTTCALDCCPRNMARSLVQYHSETELKESKSWFGLPGPPSLKLVPGKMCWESKCDWRGIDPISHWALSTKHSLSTEQKYGCQHYMPNMSETWIRSWNCLLALPLKLQYGAFFGYSQQNKVLVL